MPLEPHPTDPDKLVFRAHKLPDSTQIILSLQQRIYELEEALHQIRTHTLYSPTGAVHLIASAALAKVGESK